MKIGKISNRVYYDINPTVLLYVGKNKKVLDIGCGPGTLGKIIRNMKNYVVGIDVNPKAVMIAKKVLDEAYISDIEKKFPAKVLSKKFDIIICADILEHLHNPDSVLETIQKLLKSEGLLIISLPNVATWTVRLKLLFGKFNYTPTGILDKTHVRFYTYRSGTQLIESKGFCIKEIDVTPNGVRAFLPVIRKIFSKEKITSGYDDTDKKIIKSYPYRIYNKIFYPVELMISRMWKRLLGYQFIFVCTKNDKFQNRNK